MNNQTAYWLWLQEILGYGSKKIPPILEMFTFAEDFYRAPLEEKLLCGCFTEKDIKKLQNTSLENARSIIKRCKECEIDIVNIGDVAYPKRLMNIEAPPAVIYVKGNKEVLSDFDSIAMVGTRSATPYGLRNAIKLSYDLASAGYTIVSGGAVGIDTYSHRGALQANGKTVCVLGCGIMYKYLQQNDDLKSQILGKGAVISEYPPDMRVARYNFPLRNRIISGLSKGVLVVEAGSGSGSLITANIALDQHKDVFAVPGDISSEVSFGTNQLIKDGAYPVTAAEDIIWFYNGETVERRKTPRKAPPKKTDDSNLLDMLIDNDSYKMTKKKKKTEKSAKQVKEESKNSLPKISEKDFNSLDESLRKLLLSFDGEIMHVDSLVEKSGLPINIVHSAITQLELFDYIKSLEGRNYKILVSIK